MTKQMIFISLAGLFISTFAFAETDAVYHLKTVNIEVAKAAFTSYSEGHFRFIQDGQLIEAYDVDQSKPSCTLQSGKMNFDPTFIYKLESTRSLDPDTESGEIELNFATYSDDPESYFQMYCFQDAPGANIETAKEALKTIFEIE